MRVERASYFVQAVRAGSIRAAAEQMELTSSGVSEQITALEEELDVVLLHRGRRGITLTDAGRVVFDRAVDLIRAQERLFDAAANATTGISGRVRVGANPLLAITVVTPAIISIGRQHAALHTQITESASSDLEIQISRGLLDFAVISTPPEPPLKSVRREHVATYPMAAYVPAASELSNRRTLRWTDLANAPLVSMRRGTTLGDRMFAALDKPHVIAEVASLHHVAYMVDNGMGIGIGVPLDIPFGEQRGMWRSIIDAESVAVQIASPTDIPMPRQVRAVRDAVRTRLIEAASAANRMPEQ